MAPSNALFFWDLPWRRRSHCTGSALRTDESASTPPDDFPIVNDRSVAAEAPGKLILFGEHAVVYGEPSVAAALTDLCISVLVSPTYNGMLRVQLIDLDIYVEIDTSHLLALQPRIVAPPTKQCSQTIEALLLSVCSNISDQSLMVSALTPLLYMVLLMLPGQVVQTGLDVLVRSQSLPVGAGLGSSAAFSTAMAAALHQLVSPSRELGVPNDVDLNEIEKVAYFSEQILHGTPSGIDNAVSAHGGVILFQRATAERPAQLTHLPTSLALPPMMLVNTHVPRSTKQLVAHVRDQTLRHPNSARTVLQAMGEIAMEFVASLSAVEDSVAHSRRLFFEQVRLNQNLLRSVGVSHQVIDAICEVVSSAGGTDAAAKLTGAGGGGCVIVAFEEAKSATLQNALRRRFPALTFLPTHVGGPGVRWIPPEKVLAISRAESEDETAYRRKLRRALWVAVAVASTVSVGVAIVRPRHFNPRPR